MPNNSYTQQELADQSDFHTRVGALLVTQAFLVMAEAPPVPSRRAYAEQVLSNVAAEARRVSRLIVMRTNLMAFTTSWDPPHGIVTAAGDPDILSQIATDWDVLAGA